jgi:polysaccharide biosynthesis transport protein
VINTVSIALLLWRRKKTIFFCGVAFAGLSFGASRILPMQYTSEGSLIVDDRPLAATTGGSQGGNTDILTEEDVLMSSGLILRTVQAYNLTHLPDLIPKWRLPTQATDILLNSFASLARMWHSMNNIQVGDSETDKTVLYIQQHLLVQAGSGGKKKETAETTDKTSSVITINFTAGSPEAAATVANAITTTYLTGARAARDADIARLNHWIDEQLATYKRDIAVAELSVTMFEQAHNMARVQGSLTPSISLSHEQEQLTLAQVDLARLEKALETARQGNIAAASEALESKTVQMLKEQDAKLGEQLAYLSSPTDARRQTIKDERAEIHRQLDTETRLVGAAIVRAVEIGRARVQVLEQSVKMQTTIAQAASVADANLRQLTDEVESRRRGYISFLTEAQQMQLRIQNNPSARVLFAAIPPLRPSHSLGMLSLVLGFILGGSGASGTIVLRTILNKKLRSAEEVLAATGLPVAGSLPDFNRNGEAPFVRETIRAMGVAMLPDSNEGCVVLVTSSEMEEGKTTVAAALACRFSEDGYKVLLIDADLRRPRLAKKFRLIHDERLALEAVLNGDISLDEAVCRVTPNLHCLLSAGSTNPVKSLGSGFDHLVANGKQHYDFVIVDSPPVLHVADPIMLAKWCQRILFIIQSGLVPNIMIREAIRRFADHDRAKMMIVLTRVRRKQLDNRFYYSGYNS